MGRLSCPGRSSYLIWVARQWPIPRMMTWAVLFRLLADAFDVTVLIAPVHPAARHTWPGRQDHPRLSASTEPEAGR